MRKVFIIHPSYDYGCHSAYSTLELAEKALREISSKEWEEYKALIPLEESDDSFYKLEEDYFFDKYYIDELEVEEPEVNNSGPLFHGC